MKKCPECDAVNAIDRIECFKCGSDFPKAKKIRRIKDPVPTPEAKEVPDTPESIEPVGVTIVQVIGVFTAISGIYAYINKPFTMIILGQILGINLMGMYAIVNIIAFRIINKNNAGLVAIVVKILQWACILGGLALLFYWTDDRRLYETHLF
ncbi:hypothetical protein KAJ27_16410 [bacterium]|nr:hypothetical protein [bacterium]